MLKSGWLRLWIVGTCSILVVALSASTIYIWGTSIGYRFFTVSISDQVSLEDRKLADSIKEEATKKTFQGEIEYSPVLTLEDLAKRGVVTQVAFQWLEPSGWSGDQHDEIDVLNREEIKTSEIIRRASRYVHRARLRRAAVYISPVLPVCVAALLLGIGVAWISKGFATS